MINFYIFRKLKFTSVNKGLRLGLKDNIKAIQEEISTEEHFLEGIIKSERFYKRYKKYIVAGIVVLVAGGVAYGILDVVHKNNIKVSNEAYAILTKEPKNKDALETLKQKNIKLYEVFVFQQASLNEDRETLKNLSLSAKDSVLADLSAYKLSQLDKNSSFESELLAGFVFLKKGYDLLSEGKIEEAKLKFAQIDASSPVKQIAKNLEHYQGLK
ncbi:MAG: hypothetical protein PHN38_01200 [Sulfurospirillaceae bacterium]|nr:hypothetical protein [Sulfurospirillaceae bacterium]MDD3462388.1 hypothetical protein [Sulfurospirillaceae bacterium]